jgi:hypothetical protein
VPDGEHKPLRFNAGVIIKIAIHELKSTARKLDKPPAEGGFCEMPRLERWQSGLSRRS